jgi:hypothetical protein
VTPVPAIRTITWDPVTGTQQIEMTLSDGTTTDLTDDLTSTEAELSWTTSVPVDPA